jgi:dCTP deaminase
MTILNDRQIRELAEAGMIEPFHGSLVRALVNGRETRKVLSFGLSSYGYDIRLSHQDFRVFRHVPGTVIDPKDFNQANLEPSEIHWDYDDGDAYYILPAHTYALGVARERLKLPPDVTALCIGKSTYARCGIIVNATPAEAGWEGHLTLEFSNSSDADCRIYADEGIAQMLFFRGEPCATCYDTRQGKYQGQPEAVVPARI